MAHFLTLQVQQCFGDDPPADLPSITDKPEYAQWQDQLKKAFLAELVRAQELYTLEFGFGPAMRMCLQVRTFKQTSALVHVGVMVEEGSAERRLAGAWLLLTGYADSDQAAVEAVQAPGAVPFFPPGALEAAAQAPKPLVVQLSMPVLYETGTMELFLVACRAFADAFFDQFGESGKEDEELPPPPDLE